MLKYLITGTECLIAGAILLGMLFAYIYRVYGQKGRRILAVSSFLAFLAAAVMSYMKNKTKLIDTGWWNLHIFGTAIAVFLLFLLFDLRAVRRKLGKADEYIVPLLAAVMGFCQIFYALPDVLGYPYNFVLGGENVLSTGFLYRLIGLILGIILVIVAGLAVHFVCGKIPLGLLAVLLKLAFLTNAFQWGSKILQTLLSRRIITGKGLFRVVKFTSNHASLFPFIIMGLAFVAPVVMWVYSMCANEPYKNPAEHRKIKAGWRSIRRWSATVFVSLLLCAMNMTTIKAYANRPVELSPVEDCEVVGDNVIVPFEAVEDGHLHRFAWTSDKGVAIRFIIIKKPNSSSYGIGLD
ncbi:MAG: hypothetical protein J5947_04795, partial [Clostridium sp.]|nr:hypothetical protein [Clostridium sp.]